jgi:hypothetical protein
VSIWLIVLTWSLSDFWLFDHMKGALAGQQFTPPVNLLDGIQAFLNEIQKSELGYVFHYDIERVR